MSSDYRDKYEVGQKMILKHDRCDPTVVKIERLTKKQIIVRRPGARPDDKSGIDRFEREAFCVDGSSDKVLWIHMLVGGYRAARYNPHRLYDYSEEAMTKLQEQHAEAVRKVEDRRQAAEVKQRERDEQRDRELAEVKKLCGGQLTTVVKLAMTQLDGTRIYVLDCPVAVRCSERKKGWEVVIVRCKNVEELDREQWSEWREEHRGEEMTEQTTEAGRKACMVQMTEYVTTWTNGGSYSFPSCSSEKAANDDEALWECLRHVYFQW